MRHNQPEAGKNAITATAADVERIRKHAEEVRHGTTKTSKRTKRFRGKPDLKRVTARGAKCPHCGRHIEERDLALHEKGCSRKASRKFWKRLAKCPSCHTHFLKEKLPIHMTKSHGQTFGTPANLPIRFEPLPPLPAPTRTQTEGLVPCQKCHEMVYPDALQKHMLSFHSPEAELRAILSSAHKLPFVLLPPGRLRDAIEEFRSLSRTHCLSLDDAAFDWERLEVVESFGPTARYIGLKLWKGYVVFQFGASDPVVLECPLTGNATYIIKGDWRRIVPATKATLRSTYRQLASRVIHNATWETRLWHAVFR